MRKAFLITLILTLSTLLIVSYFHFKKRVLPHTYLGKINISGMQKPEVEKLLLTQYDKPFQTKIQNRMYAMQYKHIGVVLDIPTTIRLVFDQNTQSFPADVIAFAKSLKSQQMMYPSLIFSQDYVNFVENARFNFTQHKDIVAVDNVNKTLSLTDNEVIYKISSAHFQSLLLFHYGDKNVVLEPQLVQVINTAKQDTIRQKNDKLIALYSTPIDVVVQDEGRMIRSSITPVELKRVFDVSYNDDIVFNTHKDALLTLIQSKIDPFIDRNKKIDYSSLTDNVLGAFTSRVKGLQNAPVLGNTVFSPLKEVEQTNTHGEIANRYIEVSISKQKMYLWDGGQLLRTYPVSTGLYYPTPVGHFNIINKAPEGYSDIYNVYMPWWMAFYYGWAGGQDAYFGIHELPYWYVGQEKKQRPREFLGSPHTGGCVSLDIGAAKEVYDFSYVGMDVVSYK